MSSTDALKIGISLLITVAVVTVTIVYTRQNSSTIASGASESLQLVQSATLGPIERMRNTNRTGTEVLFLVDYYSSSVPILVVTEELYNSSAKLSYDVARCREKKAPEYLNPDLNYYVDASISVDNRVEWIRIVQSTLTEKTDLPTVESTVAEYNASLTYLNLHNTLLETQYKAYLEGLQ